MLTLNLETKSEAQKRLKEFLEQNVSDLLADKINNGVYIEKDGKRLLNKKTLDGFVKYATAEAKKQAAKGETGAFLENDVVFGWLIHYYEALNDHATTLANELNLTLTGRDCGLDERVPMVGIPFHAVYDYVNKIIERGYKVILAENSDDFLKFKDIDENEEPDELSEEEMKKFDSYVDEDTDELPTVSKIVGTTDDDEDCTELLNAESAKAFDSETVCIISELLDGQITLA